MKKDCDQPSRRTSTVIQFVGNIVLMGFAAIQGFFLVPLYLSRIGETVYGSWLALSGFIGSLSVLELGLTTWAGMRVAEYGAASRWLSVCNFLLVLGSFATMVFVIIGIAGFASAGILPSLFKVAPECKNDLINSLQIATVEAMLMFIAGTIGAVLNGLQRPLTHTVGMVVGTAGAVATTVFLLLQGWGVLAIPCGSLVRPLIVMPVSVLAITKILRGKISWIMIRFDPSIVSQFVEAAWWMGPSRLAQGVTSQIDAMIVMKILQPLDVTILSLTRRISDFVVQLIGRMSTSSQSGLAHLHGAGQKEKFREVILFLILLVGYPAVLSLGAIIIYNNNFVALWAGPHFFAGGHVNSLICFYGFVKIFQITCYSACLATNAVRAAGLSFIVEAVLQTVFGILLVSFFGISGVVIAGLIAVATSCTIQALSLVNFCEILINDLLKLFARIFLGIIPVWFLCAIVSWFWPPKTWEKLMSEVVLYILLASISILIREPVIRKFLTSKVRNRFLRGLK